MATIQFDPSAGMPCELLGAALLSEDDSFGGGSHLSRAFNYQ